MEMEKREVKQQKSRKAAKINLETLNKEKKLK